MVITLCLLKKLKPIYVLTKIDKSDCINDIENECIEYIKTICNDIAVNSNEKIDKCGTINMIRISNVDDTGYDELVETLQKINRLKRKTEDYQMDEEKLINNALFLVNDVFKIPEVCSITYGTLLYGVMLVDNYVNVLCNGIIHKFKIKSIQRKTLNVDRLFQGETGSITFYDKVDNIIDKTCVIIGNRWINELKTRVTLKSIFSNQVIKLQNYSLFIDNFIMNVNVIYYDYVCDEYTIESSTQFIYTDDIGVLKDENGQIIYVKITK
jgi:hypothetical protein